MLCDGIISKAIGSAEERRLGEVIIGLGFTLVFLDDGACGLAYTLRAELERGCDVFEEAGGLRGRELQEVLPWIRERSVIASSVGLAAANALLHPPAEAFAADLLSLLRLEPGESVVTVGRFRPLEPGLKKAGVDLGVIENGDSDAPLSDCDVALISATSIINNSIDSLLQRTARAREIVILGPSTPYAPEAFGATPVTILAGSVVSNADRVRTVVSEGGGTKTMGKALRRWVSVINVR